jgi:hypothetical protein
VNPKSILIGLAPGIESVIDATGDLQVCSNTAWKEKKEAEQKRNSKLEELVTADPTITLDKLEEEIGMPASSIGRLLKSLRWYKSKGGAKDGHGWVKKPILGSTSESS